MERQASETKLYSKLAAGLPEDIASTTSNPEQTRTLLSSALDANFLETQFGSVVPQLVNHYRTGAPAPTLDLTEFDRELKQAGVVVPPDVQKQLSTPQTLGSSQADKTFQQTAQATRILDWAAPLAALVLIVLIFFIAGHARFAVLSTVGYIGALLTGFAGILVLFIPGLVPTIIGDSFAKPLAGGLLDYAKAVAGDMANQLFVGAGILLVVGIILSVIHVLLRVKHKVLPPKPKAAKPAA
jgi:hypothetical protein